MAGGSLNVVDFPSDLVHPWCNYHAIFNEPRDDDMSPLSTYIATSIRVFKVKPRSNGFRKQPRLSSFEGQIRIRFYSNRQQMSWTSTYIIPIPIIGCTCPLGFIRGRQPVPVELSGVCECVNTIGRILLVNGHGRGTWNGIENQKVILSGRGTGTNFLASIHKWTSNHQIHQKNGYSLCSS